MVKSAGMVIRVLSGVILNNAFQKIIASFKTSYGDEDYGAVTNAMILKCKEWMIENKGNYILNADYPAY